MSTDEPPSKKMKIKNEEFIENLVSKLANRKGNLIPIISEDFTKPVQLTKVVVGTIKNVKDISRTILTLNQKVPMKELQHLKRVSKKEVIICPVNNLTSSIEEFIEKNVGDLKDVFESFREADVPESPPKVKRQFADANKVWPCNFHPNKYSEKLVSGSYFNDQELETHKAFMGITLEVVKFYINLEKLQDDEFKLVNASVVVDPSIQSVVAISFDNRREHSVQHSAMLAIDNVAKTQNGGVWFKDKHNAFAIDSKYRGVDPELLSHLKDKFPDVKFGAKKFVSKKDVVTEEIDKTDSIGPYLCTGYSVYMLREPCVMCSMALVHARARRVFFCLQNEELGALKSRAKLQTVSSLNHHFEVFTGFV